MSVVALFTSRDGVVDSIPVATESLFEELWGAGISVLGLEWLPLFQGGLFIELDDWPPIREELARLHRWAAEHLSEDDADYVTRRIDRLLDEVPVRLSRGDEVWIG
jgi:hypothetical protein